MKDAYYFSHDSNARNDEKILMLRAEHGLEGYGAYWILIEMMFESADTSLCHDKVKGIAYSNNIDITVLQQIIDTAITEGLFDSDGIKFWSESLIRRKDKYRQIKQQKSEAGKKGMAKRWASDNTVITEDNSVITKDNKGKERKGKESKEKKIYYAEFVSLTLTEYTKLVQEYGELATKRMITKLDNYKGSSNKKYASDYRAILSWVVDEVLKESETKQAPLGLQEYDMSNLGKREEGWQ